MAEKSTKLSIVIRTVDQATARIKVINDRLDAMTKPVRDFRSALSDLREKSGLNGVIDGFKGVGSAIGGVLAKIGLIGGVVGGAVIGLKSMIDEFDQLGDKASHIGVSVDFLAQMRFAAEKSGAEVEALDAGMQKFAVGLGLARKGTGKLSSFLKDASPALLKQLKATKTTEEATDLLAQAMTKIKDPATRAGFAMKTLGDASLAPMLFQGADGLKALRAEFAQGAPDQAKAAAAAGEFGDSMDNLKVTLAGVKAALVIGLAPALKVIIDRLREWFSKNRENIAAWAKDIGERLPDAIKSVVEWLGKAWDKVTGFVDAIGGLGNAAIGLVAIGLAPLISSVLSLSAALVTAISRAGQLGTAMAGASAAGGKAGMLSALGPAGLAIGGAYALSELTGGPIGEDQGGVLEWAKAKLKPGQGVTDITNQVRNAMLAGLSAENRAKIEVDFKNAPPGTRVNTDPSSTAEVDTRMGLNMYGAL